MVTFCTNAAMKTFFFNVAFYVNVQDKNGKEINKKYIFDIKVKD